MSKIERVIKLGVSGALGKMGGRILSLAAADRDFQVVLALEKPGHPLLGEKVADVEVVSTPGLIGGVDCFIDFSTPEGALEHLQYALRFKKPMVIGATGFSEGQKEEIAETSRKIPIVFSPNMSIGVNLLFSLVRQAAKRLPPDYKVRMSESHHTHKKDAPSGTARLLAQIVKDEMGQEDIDIHSIREGEIIGDHEVVFESPWDMVRLSHSAKTRDIFALGALRAVKFLVGKPRGLYSMEDVLNDKE